MRSSSRFLLEVLVIIMRWLSLLFLLALPLFTSGCAIKSIPVVAKECHFVSYDLAVEQPHNLNDAASPRRNFGDVLRGALFSHVAADAAAPSQSMLFLSGGSLHGAFGAGFLDEWKHMAPEHKLPDFKVVTGISTGAILSTFAFIDQPERGVEGYTIDREADLLTPLGPVKNGEPTTAAYVKLLQKGALADLDPLRQRMRRFIDDATLREVAAEGTRGRLLLIGVVDVDTGQAVVLDLTEMAKQYVLAPDQAARTVKHDCYVEGVLASSSAPLAAKPVFIDNRMYIDGGARFGMFSDEIGAQITSSLADSSAKPAIYLLINGDQEINAECGKMDPANCPGGLDPAGNYSGAHADWSFLKLAARSEGILANQVYRFSAFSVAQTAKQRGIAFHPIKIEDDMLAHKYPRLDDGQPAPDSKTCSDWHAIDRAESDPLQFYPKYMRCVIDYGRSRVPGEFAKWSTAGPGPF
jgi:hypothetical protein